jgi:hypothetical protein
MTTPTDPAADPQASAALLPCPMCGAAARYADWDEFPYTVACTSDACVESPKFGSNEAAARWWNRRPTPPQAPQSPPSLPASAELDASDWRMDAYYFGFDHTGVAMIDRILSAVAHAGKAYHHTEDWTDECSPPEHLRGGTCAAWIQYAAKDAADAIDTLRARVAELERAPRDCARSTARISPQR